MVGSLTLLNWHQAVQSCDSLVFGGYSDWRLPTQKELMEGKQQSIKYLDEPVFCAYPCLVKCC
ncbi:MAG: DUF1566 domain-containing protein [Oligoflexus sp.]|nr:DUF1566 domain-containing protein [Oligoflexus sp.]